MSFSKLANRYTASRITVLIAALIFLFTLHFNNPCTARADISDSLTVKVNDNGNLITTASYTLSDLQGMPQRQMAYTSIDSMPAPLFTAVEGIMLNDLLTCSNVDIDSVQSIKLTATDGYSTTMTRQFLLDTPRYYYPNIKTCFDADNFPQFKDQAEDNKSEVDPILALRSYQERLNDQEQYEKMDNSYTIRLCFGQSTVSELTNNKFVKWITEIEVTGKTLTDPNSGSTATSNHHTTTTDTPTTIPTATIENANVVKWDKVSAEPSGGPVVAKTAVRLSHPDAPGRVKIYYTTDGSTPSAKSSLYDAKGGESIIISYDTNLKAIAIGEDKKNSDIAVFCFTFKSDKTEESTSLNPAPATEDTLAITQPKSFSDTNWHWAKNNCEKLAGLGAINGYPDGSFKPDNTITRAEFATVLVKAFHLTPQSGWVFSDTRQHWAKEYIMTACYNGFVKGYSDQAFGPDLPITREQMAVMIARAANLYKASGTHNFADSSSISSWARTAVTTLVNCGLMNGYSSNTINPKGNATRAEAVTVIANTLARQ